MYNQENYFWGKHYQDAEILKNVGASRILQPLVEKKLLSSKLMRLGPTNQIVNDSVSKAVDVDRRFRSDSIPTILIELIKNCSIFDVNQFKSIIFDILSIKRSI